MGWASLRDLPPAADMSHPDGAEVDATFARDRRPVRRRLAGPATRAADRSAGRATEPEQRFLGGLVAGELRQGALASMVTDAVARAAGLPADDVRHA